ncbi:39S ribosomal protein L52, mitochondrial [Gracilinanus agilis]|uniref:39S ribosomal protein L52, mitochondrial n=1 Tax=Gracilinanus agilis TaxID=191870 RepID=UPI001CFED71F|nr:39S ribosomal protein L52, mitochondrial [Gracilinanus agilis]
MAAPRVFLEDRTVLPLFLLPVDPPSSGFLSPPLGMAGLAVRLLGVRRLHLSVAGRAGGAWRTEQGLAASPSGYGPLTELPDWSYADGRSAPPMKGQLQRREQREKFARRVVLLSQEIDAGLKTWELKQQEKRLEEEKKKQNRLKPKGAAMKVP